MSDKDLHKDHISKRSNAQADMGTKLAELTLFRAKLSLTLKSVALVSITLLLLWQASDIFLLIFAGLLLAVFLHSLSDPLAHHSKLGPKAALAVVILALIGIGVLFSSFVLPQITDQFQQLSERLPQSFERIRQAATQQFWLRRLFGEIPSWQSLFPQNLQILSRLQGVLSSTMGVLAGIAIFLFVGLYMSVDPQLYKKGLVRLAPVPRRERMSEVMDHVGHTLRWWLLGKIISMSIIGVFTTIGLWIIGIPLALALGVIAALLTFIPNFGPVLSAVPAVLLGLMQSPTQALYVIFLYVGIQTVESYIITPLIQHRTVSLPPALTLVSQVIMALLFGFMGLLLATPLMAALLVLVNMLYIEDLLGEGKEPRQKPLLPRLNQ